jgi:hypothetical protein
MHKLSRIVAAAVTFLSLPAGVALAQTTPNTGAGTTTAAPPAAPAATTTPAATATTPPAGATAAQSTTEPAQAPKKKKAAKMTRQQEIDKSIDSGTVPARYRSSVPKEYQHYIPFDKK